MDIVFSVLTKENEELKTELKRKNAKLANQKPIEKIIEKIVKIEVPVRQAEVDFKDDMKLTCRWFIYLVRKFEEGIMSYLKKIFLNIFLGLVKQIAIRLSDKVWSSYWMSICEPYILIQDSRFVVQGWTTCKLLSYIWFRANFMWSKICQVSCVRSGWYLR